MDIEQARYNMVEQQIRPWDVLNQAVLDLLSKVRREDFVPAAHQALAFVDMGSCSEKLGVGVHGGHSGKKYSGGFAQPPGMNARG